MAEDPELLELRKRRMENLLKPAPAEATREPGPVRVDDDTIEAELQKPGVLLLDLWAVWCGPCIRMDPVIHALAREYEGKARVAKLNVDESPYTAARYGVVSIPMFLIFRDGRLVEEVVGAMPRQALEARLQRWLQAA